jgi:aminopeptidase N
MGKKDLLFGRALDIKLPFILKKGDSVSISIYYSTTSGCTAIQWLDPSQTCGKKLPYLFTQCQAIHCRSLLPCQDTPGIKATYTAQVSCPENMRALMSAVPTKYEKNTFYFEQKIAIPSYLIALAVGDIVGVKIGPRSTVWSEPSVVEKAAWEFKDTESFICTAEEMLTPYCWGVYDLLVLPPSFPYGGFFIIKY